MRELFSAIVLSLILAQGQPLAAILSEPQVLGTAIQASPLVSGLAKVQQWEQVAEARGKNPATSLTLSFTAVELQAITRDALKKLKSPPLEPDSVTVQLRDGVVTVRGKMLKPFKLWVSITLTALIKQGKLEPSIVNAKLGWLPVGGRLVEDMASEVFGSRWRSELNPPGMNWKAFTIKDTVALEIKRTAR